MRQSRCRKHPRRCRSHAETNTDATTAVSGKAESRRFDGEMLALARRGIRLPPEGGAPRNFRILASRIEQDQNPDSVGALYLFARLFE
jgi:hypothetical protein